MASSGRSSIVYSTPVGVLKLEATKEGICSVKWLSSKKEAASKTQSVQEPTTEKHDVIDDKEEASLKKTRSEERSSKAINEHFKICTAWLDAYFDGTLLEKKPPLPKPPLVLPEKGSFFHSVWETLTTTGIGETLSYKELAKLSGNPNAARAVGRAVQTHCIPILVPCHRVVKSVPKGSSQSWLGNYSGGEGPATKEWLLEHEKKMLQGQQGQSQ